MPAFRLPGEIDRSGVMRHSSLMFAPLFIIGQADFGIPWLLFALAPVMAAPIWWWRRDENLWPKVLWLFLPFLPWILVSYWTALRWHKDNEPISSDALDSAIALSSIGLTLLLAIAGVVRGKGGRMLIAYSGLINGWIAVIGAVICVMATSGGWI